MSRPTTKRKASALEDQARTFTVADYERMSAANVFDPEERLELIAGKIITRDPRTNVHEAAVELARRALERAFGEDFWVRLRSPLRFPDQHSEPEPDLAVVRGAPRTFVDLVHPYDHPSHALLVVEITDSPRSRALSLAKVGIYAAAGIDDYWIVDLDRGVVDVHRSRQRDRARGGSYGEVRRSRRKDVISVHDASVAVADLLP